MLKTTNTSRGIVYKPTEGNFTLLGNLLFDYGLPAPNIDLRLYNVGFAGSDTKLAETKSDAHGNYSFSYRPPASGTSLEVRAADSKNKETVLSAAKFNAQSKETMNLVVPGTFQPLTGEFDRLSGDIGKTIGGIEKLTNAQENSSRQDLTLLYQSTGWDARLVALAANAASLAKTSGMDTGALYALFRVGLPTDPQKLAVIPSSAVQLALAKASQAGIHPMTAAQITSAVASFQTFTRKARVALNTAGSAAPLSDFLTPLKLGDKQNAFLDLYFDPTVPEADLWTKAAQAGVPVETINKMKLQGKLGHLTLNNTALVTKLQQEVGAVENLSQLAAKDFHAPAAWQNLLTGIAGKDPAALAKLIPPAYQGATPQAGLENYSAHLARKIRLSFPTHTVARMVESGDLPVSQADSSHVVSFLRTAADQGYNLGKTPLNAFLQKLPAGIPKPPDTALKSIKSFHRLYQMTPSSESMKAAHKLGFQSARDVAGFTHKDFMKNYSESFPSKHEASMTYYQSQQISSVTFNLFTAAQQLDSNVPVAAVTSSPAAHQDAKKALVAQYPNLQSLFGSLDFCECQDCRSVLSPAAYLVDILKFIDPADLNWNTFLANWSAEHGGKVYLNQSAGSAPMGTPYSVLAARRPDLANLPLTCENTNTVLPYIDVVNEILEYYLVNKNLTNAVYDTGSAESADLIAEPQNVLEAAYGILDNQVEASPAVYPIGLPFDLWIETVRGFLNYFKIPFSNVLETFRPAENLELFTGPNPYHWDAIFAESLGFTPAEVALLTNPVYIANWFELYGYTVAESGTALADLSTASTLADSLGISYQDLTDLVMTGFLNPAMASLIRPMEKFNLSLNDVFTYTSQPGYPAPGAAPMDKGLFESNLAALMAKYYPGSDPNTMKNWLNNKLVHTPASQAYSTQVLVLQDPDASGCNFSETTYQYAGGAQAAPQDFYKLSLFVRIWKKLGWTMDETDQALQVFLSPYLPKTSDPDYAAKFNKAVQTALVYLAHLKSLSGSLQEGPYGLTGLLPLFTRQLLDPTKNTSPITALITGENALFAQIFFKPGILQNDPIFDDPTGLYLLEAPASTSLISQHLVSLQGALGLTAGDVSLILADANLNPATAALTLGNVFTLYAYGLLADGLQISVKELIALKALSGLNPFTAPSAGTLSVLGDDPVWNQTLLFVKQAGVVQGSGFTVEDLHYLLRQELLDPVGKYSPDDAALMQQIRALAVQLDTLQSQNAIPSDPMTFTDDVLRQKLALVFPADVSQKFIAMWTGTYPYTAVQTGVAAAIPASVFGADSGLVQMDYDSTLQTLTLTLTQAPTTAFVAQLTNDINQALAHSSITAAQQTVLQSLVAAAAASFSAFFQNYFEASTLGSLATGFMTLANFESLFVPSAPGETDDQKNADLSAKRSVLANAFLPYLKSRLSSQAVIQTLAAAFSVKPPFMQTFVTNNQLLCDPTDPTLPLLNAFEASTDQGLTVSYYSDTALKNLITSGPAGTADTTDHKTPKPLNTKSVRYEGYLEVPADGPYRLTAATGNPAIQVVLQFDIQSSPLLLGAALSQVIQLKAGIPYHFTLDGQDLNADLKLQVQGEKLPLGPLSQLTLYPSASVDRFRRARLLLSKMVQLTEGFNLTEKEILYLSANGADFDQLNFSGMPTEDLTLPAEAVPVFKWFLRLAAYGALKKGPAGGSDSLVDLFQSARQNFLHAANVSDSTSAVLAGIYQQVAALTRRDIPTVQSTVQQLKYDAATAPVPAAGQPLKVGIPAFFNEIGFSRLWDALQMVQTLGLGPDKLAGATGIVDPSKTNDDRFVIAGNLKNAVKAHYQPGDWRAIAQSVFDPIRQKKRDALCDYLLSLKPIEDFGAVDTNGLFEFFLVDPGMEPVVTTSRLRLALSSVQTFIQRCLLNLEAKVDPSAVDSGMWEWVKRYRIWQANREIFLWPENWMIPEFRMDKSDLYQALESALLQGDITRDLAEKAFYDYLSALEGRARLDIVAMYFEQPETGPTVLHVLGRNFGKPQKYFYRTFTNGAWTAWIPVTADVDGDHIVLAVWRQRVNLFWVTFAVTTPPTSTPSQESSNTGTPPVSNLSLSDLTTDLSTGSVIPHKMVQSQLNWSEYYQGKWSKRKSTDMTRATKVDVGFDFDPTQVRPSVEVKYEEDSEGNTVEGPLYILLSDPLSRYFTVNSKNTEPQFRYWDWDFPETPDYVTTGKDATKVTGYGALQIDFTVEYKSTDGSSPTPTQGSETILQQGENFSLLYCGNPVNPAGIASDDPNYRQAGALMSPIFYSDRDTDTTLFVQPSLTEKTTTTHYGWIPRPILVDPNMVSPDWYNNVNVVAQVPVQYVPNNPVGPDPAALYQLGNNADWVTNPATLVSYGTTWVGQSGGVASDNRIGLVMAGIDEAGSKTALAETGGSFAVANAPLSASSKPGLSSSFTSMNLVGSAGLNFSMLNNLSTTVMTATAANVAAKTNIQGGLS